MFFSFIALTYIYPTSILGRACVAAAAASSSQGNPARRSDMIPRWKHVSLSLSGWGLAVRTRCDSMSFTGIHGLQITNQFLQVCIKLHYLKEISAYYTCQTQFRRQLILMNGAVCSKVHMHTFQLFYILYYNKGERNR